MGMPDTARRYTVEEVLAFPSDGNRYELVHGELLVSAAPPFRHQVIAGVCTRGWQRTWTRTNTLRSRCTPLPHHLGGPRMT